MEEGVVFVWIRYDYWVKLIVVVWILKTHPISMIDYMSKK